MRPTLRRAVTILTAAVATQLAHAAPTLTIKRLPTSIPVAQLQASVLPVLAAQNQQKAALAQQTRQQINVALSAMAPEQKALSAALAGDPRYKTLMDQAQTIVKSGGDAKARSSLLQKLFNANRVVFDDAARAAKVTPATLQTKAAGGLLTSDLALVFKPAVPLRTALSLASTTPSSIPDMVVTPPLDFESSDKDNGGLAITGVVVTADADLGQDDVLITVAGVAGAANGTGTVGKTIPVPAGVKRVELTVSVARSYDAFAVAVAGAGIGCTGFTVAVQTVEQSRSLDGDSDDQCVTAIIGWYAEASGNETRDHFFSVAVPEGVHNLLVTASADASGTGGGLTGGTNAQSVVTINQIRAHFLN